MRLFSNFILISSIIIFFNFSCTTDKQDLLDKIKTISSTGDRIYFKTRFTYDGEEMVSVNSVISNQKGLIVDSIFGKSDKSLVNSLTVFGMEDDFSYDLKSAFYEQSKSSSILKQVIGPIYSDQYSWLNYLKSNPTLYHNEIENYFTLFSSPNSKQEVIIKYNDENQITAIDIKASNQSVCTWTFDYLSLNSYRQLKKAHQSRSKGYFL